MAFARCRGILVLLACTGCLLRAGPGEPPLVGDVHIEGNSAVPEDDITDRIALTRSGSRFIAQFGDRMPFDDALIEADSRRIERFYQSRGFFLAQVVDVRFEDKQGRRDITFVVKEGPAAKVKKLEVTGLEALDPKVRAAALDLPPLRPGDVFTEEDYDDFKSLLRDRLRATGYAEAKVEGEVRVDRTVPSAEISLQVTPGVRFTISKVHVFGAQAISRSRVAEQTELKEGQLFTPQALAAAQQRVYVMGIFSLVKVEPGAFSRDPASGTGTVPIVVELTEAPFITVEAGAGFEVDPTRDIGRVRAKATHRNIARGLQRVSVGGSVGYAFLPGIVSWLSGKGSERGVVGDGFVEFVQPRVWRSWFDGQVRLDYDKDITQAFAYQQVGFRVATPFRPPFRPLTIVPSLNGSYFFGIDATDVTGSALSTAGCGPIVPGQPPEEQCTLFYAEVLVNLDFRNDPLNTRSGVLFSVGLQRAFLGDFQYWRVSPEVRGYVPLSRSLVLASRLRFGILTDLQGSREPPGVSRFFAGGATSVRAVGALLVGPLRYTVVDNPDKGQRGAPLYLAGAPVPIGGDRLLEGSLELRWTTPIESLAFAFFTDFGAVTLRQGTGSLFEPSNYIFGAGVGARYRTFLGALRVDIGRRISPFSRTASDLTINVQNQAAYDTNNPPPPNPRDPSSYRVAIDCAPSQAQFCYEEGLGSIFRGFFLYLTLGEAF